MEAGTFRNSGVKPFGQYHLYHPLVVNSIYFSYPSFDAADVSGILFVLARCPKGIIESFI